MATATAQSKAVITGITLNLTMDEANVLRALLGQCTSNSKTSTIYHALREHTEHVYRVAYRPEAGRFVLAPTLHVIAPEKVTW